MDNQQPRSKKDKVQRLSRKGVLSNTSKHSIIWETPSIQNKVFIYQLKDTISNTVRYIGSTNNPKERFVHHLKDKSSTYKGNWIRSVISNNGGIQMVVFDYSDNLNKALIKEEYYLHKFKNLTNICLYPTQGSTKLCYVYDLQTSRSMEFISLASASLYVGCTSNNLLNNFRCKGRYLFSYSDNFSKIIKDRHSFKAKKDNKILYFVSYNHASWILNCSRGLVNNVLGKISNSINGWVLCKRDGIFPICNPNGYKKVICLDDNIVYPSIQGASSYYGIDGSCIVRVCKGKRKTAGKLRFNYFE